MDTWRKPATVLYKKWRNPDRSADGFVCQSDEDQCTDSEIFTIGANFWTTNGQTSPETTNSQDAITVDDALDAIGFGKFQWKLAFLTGLSWVADSMEMMILSIIGPQLHCEWKLPSYQVALITSVVFVGMGISAPLWGYVSDKYGRKFGLKLSMYWILYYGLLTSFTPVYGWLLFLRGLVGFGIGGTPQSLTLLSEFLPVKTRGLCLMLIEVFWAVGSVLEVLLALWIMPMLGWRWLLGISAIPSAFFIGFSFWLPESPRFDLLKGKSKKALETLRYIAKDNGKTMPQVKLFTQQQDNRGRITNLFTVQYRKTTLLLLCIWLVNAFSYYGIILLTTEIFQAGKMCDTGLLISILAVNLIGRKKTMALCFFVFSLFILPLYACMNRVAVTIVISIARTFIAAGFQAAYVYTSEVFPTEIRGVGMGICVAVSRFGALLTPFVAQVLLRTSLYLTLSVYCGCCLLTGVVCLLLPIETLGRGLQESGGL